MSTEATVIRFDLVDWQKDVKCVVDKRQLYGMFDQLCRLREKRVVLKNEFQECRDLLFDRFEALRSVENAVAS